MLENQEIQEITEFPDQQDQKDRTVAKDTVELTDDQDHRETVEIPVAKESLVKTELVENVE